MQNSCWLFGHDPQRHGHDILIFHSSKDVSSHVCQQVVGGSWRPVTCLEPWREHGRVMSPPERSGHCDAYHLGCLFPLIPSPAPPGSVSSSSQFARRLLTSVMSSLSITRSGPSRLQGRAGQLCCQTRVWEGISICSALQWSITI